MKQKPESVQVRVRIPVSLLPKIEQIRVATGLFYPGEVLLLVFQWFLADDPRPVDKEIANGNVQDPDPPDPESSVAPQEKEIEARVTVQAGSLRDFMRTLAG
ncbi:MAG: hypothetical protein HC924_18255 [Synechococcaceae cyanobacterium SM2_3_2]|nr:hypothetical protein [Synechococcaceae cyanobacterium SM2_3_2]